MPSLDRNDILRAFAGEPLAIRREAIDKLILTGTVEELRSAAAARSRAVARDAGRDTAVIPIVGPITRRPSLFSDLFGGTSLLEAGAALEAALRDERVDRIVLLVDSPGGTVHGTPEFAAAVRDARGQKLILAVVDGWAASAAYWIASQASMIVASPSSDLGSIGVYSLHVSEADALTKLGLVATYIASAPEKIEMSPLLKLSDEARKFEQAQVDRLYFWFTADVAAGRGTARERVRADFGGGRMLGADQALRVGMADRIATLEEILATPPFAFERERRARAGLAPPSFEMERASRRQPFAVERARRAALQRAQGVRVHVQPKAAVSAGKGVRP